jgi:hypothetical protein
MPTHPFIGLEGERGGQASERNGRRMWCAIMVMKAAVSVGNWVGSDEGGSALAIMGAERGGAPGGGSARASRRCRRRGRAAGGGRRRGGAHASMRERDGLGRAGWLAKAQAAGPKSELGPSQEIKPFRILFKIQIFSKL